jgi:hypothetical protein
MPPGEPGCPLYTIVYNKYLLFSHGASVVLVARSVEQYSVDGVAAPEGISDGTAGTGQPAAKITTH